MIKPKSSRLSVLAQALQELTQDLLGAFAEIPVVLLPEERAQFRFGNDEIRFLEDRQHVLLAQ